MNHPSFLRRAVSLALLVFVLALAGAQWATATPAAGEAISWWVHASGGAPSSGGSITLNDTLGQALTGDASGGSASLGAGYWFAAPYSVYLPLVAR